VTEEAQVQSNEVTPTETAVAQPTGTSTPDTGTVTVKVIDGSLNIRRGPSVDYNPIGVMAEGEAAIAIGRDRIRRWLYIRFPTNQNANGWISTLTDYTQISGDVDQLPIKTVEPADPAFIRNCTKHTMWILPTQVELLPKLNEPYNELRFPPGEYLVYDSDVASDLAIQEITLREGSAVDILFDGDNEKSKCE
jgi:hypothetical protein